LTFSGVEWPRLHSFGLAATAHRDVVALTAARLPKLERLRVWPSYSTARVWTEANVRQFAHWLSAGVLNELKPTGLTTTLLRDLLTSLDTPELKSLAVFGPPSLSIADLAERDVFRGLKNLKGSLTHADLAALADPGVLPELHTIWSGDTEPLTGLRWRGGVRTVIPKDAPNDWRSRPSRGSWCG
jgi:hypothetical protein